MAWHGVHGLDNPTPETEGSALRLRAIVPLRSSAHPIRMHGTDRTFRTLGLATRRDPWMMRVPTGVLCVRQALHPLYACRITNPPKLPAAEIGRDRPFCGIRRGVYLVNISPTFFFPTTSTSTVPGGAGSIARSAVRIRRAWRSRGFSMG